MDNNTALIDIAKALIALPSITPQDAGCQNLIKDFLTPLGFHCERMNFNGVDNLWAKIGTSGPLLVFAGHTDVVATGPLTDWKSPPFTPEIRDGFLYGRGASDMKCALAAMLYAANKFLQKVFQFNGSIGFLITADEEGPSTNGTKRVMEVLDARGEKIDFCLIGEPSCDQTVGDQIRVGRRGSLHGKLNLHGKQGHVAHPHLAKNPIHTSMQALHELAHFVWDNGNQDFPATTLQITNIHGGTGATNIIPGHLEVLFNLRFAPVKTIHEIQKLAHHILNKHSLTYDLEWEVGGEPFLTKRGQLVDVVLEAIQSVQKVETKLSTGGGTSDGRFIAPYGAQIVELGLTNATAHHVNECIRVDDLEKLAEIYTTVLNLIFANS